MRLNRNTIVLKICELRIDGCFKNYTLVALRTDQKSFKMNMYCDGRIKMYKPFAWFVFNE